MKKLFVSIRDGFIFGGHIMSLGAASLVGAYSLVLGYSPDWLYLLITYLGVHSIYLFDRYKEAKSDIVTNPERAAYVEKHKKLVERMIIAYLVASFSLIIGFCGFEIALYWILMYALGFAYGVFFKKLSRKIISFKDLFVSLVYIILLLSYHAHAHIPIGLSAILLMIFAYVRLYSTEIFYDLKDVDEDKKHGLKTLAVVLSRDHYFIAITVANILSAIPLIYGVVQGLLPQYALALLLLLPYYNYYTRRSKHSRSITHLSYLYCDGEYLLWMPLVLVFYRVWL